MLKYTHVALSGDSLSTIPPYEFYFKVVLPRARKERDIVARDYLGRIIHSKVPEVHLPYD